MIILQNTKYFNETFQQYSMTSDFRAMFKVGKYVHVY